LVAYALMRAVLALVPTRSEGAEAFTLDCERGTHECAILLSKWGGPPGPQPTPSSACWVSIELNSLATGGSRGTRADQGGLPHKLGATQSGH
jgi:hypothetical protein